MDEATVGLVILIVGALLAPLPIWFAARDYEKAVREEFRKMRDS